MLLAPRLLVPGTEPAAPPLEDEVLITGPPGKSLFTYLIPITILWDGFCYEFNLTLKDAEAQEVQIGKHAPLPVPPWPRRDTGLTQDTLPGTLQVTKCVTIFPNPSNLVTPTGCPILNSVLILSAWRSHRLRAQSCETVPQFRCQS